MDDSRTLTTAQKTAAALAVECPKHEVKAGAECPQGIDGACMERRTVAQGSSMTFGDLMSGLADPGF